MRRIAIIYGLLIILVVVLADTQHLGPLKALYDFPFGDKVGHFLIFGLFSLLNNLSVLETRTNPINQINVNHGDNKLVVKTSLIISGFVGLEELSQLWFPSRNSSVFDLMASCLGIAFFAWIALRIKNKN
jgi:VanZ family protein